jgi:hypothetical protein
MDALCVYRTTLSFSYFGSWSWSRYYYSFVLLRFTFWVKFTLSQIVTWEIQNWLQNYITEVRCLVLFYFDVIINARRYCNHNEIKWNNKIKHSFFLYIGLLRRLRVRFLQCPIICVHEYVCLFVWVFSANYTCVFTK